MHTSGLPCGLRITFCKCDSNRVASSYANLSEQKKVFSKGKGLNPTGLVWNTNMAAVLLFRNTNVADVTSCEKALLTNCKMKSFYYYFHNDLEFCFLVQIRVFAVIKLFRIAKFLWILVVVVKISRSCKWSSILPRIFLPWCVIRLPWLPASFFFCLFAFCVNNCFLLLS